MKTYRSTRNFHFATTGEPSEPGGKNVDSSSKREVPDEPLSPRQPSSLCARPDQNNFEGKCENTCIISLSSSNIVIDYC